MLHFFAPRLVTSKLDGSDKAILTAPSFLQLLFNFFFDFYQKYPDNLPNLDFLGNFVCSSSPDYPTLRWHYTAGFGFMKHELRNSYYTEAFVVDEIGSLTIKLL